MKTWFLKFRISNALNSRRSLPPDVLRQTSKSAELRRFTENMESVDAALKGEKVAPETPAALHESIMRAVRRAHREEEREFNRGGIWERLIPATVLGLFLALILLDRPLSATRPQATVSPSAAPAAGMVASALDRGNALVSVVPNAAISPLTDEMARLKQDFTNAQSFLLASMP